MKILECVVSNNKFETRGIGKHSLIKDELYLYLFHANTEMLKIMKVTISMVVSDIAYLVAPLHSSLSEEMVVS